MSSTIEEEHLIEINEMLEEAEDEGEP